ncbi:MAG: alpha/beta hydrolase [Planctomycetota bacterium]|nr:alpha/beta hydrolase [Planctomycetota bacterium]
MTVRRRDYSTLPSLDKYKGADDTDLYYREYDAIGGSIRGSAVLVHGSSADSKSLHPMARALAAAGLRVFALDVRGHGSSGKKGQIDYTALLNQSNLTGTSLDIQCYFLPP